MSLIDKQLRAAKLQREFAIQRNELAYKSFNGTRQSARNFREGTLNIGQMGFDNTAEERITKEMITDYHKKEQDRSSIVMYNFGVGPRFAYVSASARAPK